MQYQGSLNLGKCAVLCSDLSSRHTGDVLLVLLMDRVLSVGWCQARIEDCGVMGQGDGHNVEAKRSCTSGKCRDLLVWPWAGRVETRLPMMNWRVSPFWWFIPWGQGCWGPILAARKKRKHWRYGLAGGNPRRSGSRMGWGMQLAWKNHGMASGGHGQELHGRTNPVSHPYCTWQHGQPNCTECSQGPRTSSKED